ncbi:MAG: hypothetical protein HY711_11250, partial [Candidatus Melainabacteria bacterium]|nr:hypothetical protein [Candidatus Melainabacteria bacterium]
IKDYLATQATYPSSELNILQCELDELMVTNCVIALEWADCFNQYLSNDFLLVKLTYLKDDGRLAILKGVGAKSQELVCKVKAILTDFLKGY